MSRISANNSSNIESFSGEQNIDSIISAPLTAVSKANAVMLKGQYEFLMTNCFEKAENGAYKPLMINLVMSSEDKKSAYVFQVPILCLLPINSLAVKDIQIKLNIDVTSVIQRQASKTYNMLQKRAYINGKICKNSSFVNGDSQIATDLSVKVKIGQLPLPKGVLSLIDLYSKSIYPIGADNPLTE